MNRTDQQLDYDAIRFGSGMRLLHDRLFVQVSGEDRVSFMHGMCTADMKSLMPGELSRALFLTERAHVIADCFIYTLQEPVFWLEVERPRWVMIREHLERFLVADDVEFDELKILAALQIEGPASTDVVGEAFSEEARFLPPWQHLTLEGFLIAKLPRYGSPAFTIIAQRDLLISAAERMKRSHPEIRDLSAETLEMLRIESGFARVGTDTNERTLALEARLEPAISFAKGCYVGQETVERATAHGSLKRRLCGLRVTGNEMPHPGSLIKLAGKDVGFLSSVASSPEAGIIGLAVLHHSAWAAGTLVSVVTDTATLHAVTSELPFVPSNSEITNKAAI
jgi:folate-binding protein YgfZ